MSESSRKKFSKPAGRDDLEDPARLVARVPERVPLVARLEDEVARAGLDDVVAEQGTHPSLEDEAVLVLARVQVQRGSERPRRHRMLHEREALARLVPVDHEANADRPEEALRSFVRAHDLRACRSRLHLVLLLSIYTDVKRCGGILAYQLHLCQVK